MNGNWLKQLDAYHVQFVVLNQRQDRDVIKILQRQSEWKIDSQGDGVVIFARTDRKTTHIS